MPHGAEKANEFKRYRQTLAALYIAIIALGFVLLAASVVRELYFRPVVQIRGPVLSSEDPAPEDLLRCHDDVLALYRDLARTATLLIALPARDRELDVGMAPDDASSDGDMRRVAGTGSDVIAAWETFSGGWLTRWDRVNAFCRFSELADTRMGEAYDRMAAVHGELPAMRLKYQSLLIRFREQQAAELSRMRRDLQRSRLLIRRAQGDSDTHTP